MWSAQLFSRIFSLQTFIVNSAYRGLAISQTRAESKGSKHLSLKIWNMLISMKFCQKGNRAFADNESSPTGWGCPSPPRTDGQCIFLFCIEFRSSNKLYKIQKLWLEQNFRFTKTKRSHQLEHFLNSNLETFQYFLKHISKPKQNNEFWKRECKNVEENNEQCWVFRSRQHYDSFLFVPFV